MLKIAGIAAVVLLVLVGASFWMGFLGDGEEASPSKRRRSKSAT